MLIATPWRGDSLGILSLRKVYGRPPCALEAPCTVVAPFDFAAGSAAEREGQLLLSMEANGVAILRGAVSVSTVAATRADLTNKLADTGNLRATDLLADLHHVPLYQEA